MGQPNFPQTPAISDGRVFVPGDATNMVDVYAAPSDKSVMVGRIRACSNDTVERDFVVSRKLGSKELYIGMFSVPIGAGRVKGTAWVDVLDEINVGEAFTLVPGEILRMGLVTNAVSSAKQIDIHLEGAPL